MLPKILASHKKGETNRRAWNNNSLEKQFAETLIGNNVAKRMNQYKWFRWEHLHEQVNLFEAAISVVAQTSNNDAFTLSFIKTTLK